MQKYNAKIMKLFKKKILEAITGYGGSITNKKYNIYHR